MNNLLKINNFYTVRILVLSKFLLGFAFTLISFCSYAQSGLDKYLLSEPEKPTVLISKDKFFEILRQQYVQMSFDRVPSFNEKAHLHSLAGILSRDYEIQLPSESGTFRINFGVTGQVLGAMNSIVGMQFGVNNAQSSLTTYMSNIKSQLREPLPISNIKDFLDEFATESEKWQQEFKQAKRDRVEANTKHIDTLRKGKSEDIKNFNDAEIFYRAENGLYILTNPMAKPNGRLFSVYGVKLDRVEKNGDILVVKLGDYYAYITNVSSAKKQVGFIENLRIGMPFRIIGKYVQNANYATVMGATKTATVFEAVYLAPH